MIGTMRPVPVCLTLLLSCAAAGCALLSASDVSQIMGTLVDPAANAIWRSVSTSVTADGVKETFPRTDQEWTELRKAASRLAEGGNLLKNENRASGNSEWMKWAQSLVDASVATLKAVDAKSPDQVMAAGELIYDACIGCHGRYSMMTPPP